MIKRLQIIANWKMTPKTAGEAKTLFEKTKRAAKKYKSLDVIVCPPNTFFGDTKPGTQHGFFLGAQNVSAEKEGAYTGEVSVHMLKSVGVSHVIIGHSERRVMGENDAVVAAKTRATLGEGLHAILCVGESRRDKEGDFFEVVKLQLEQSLHGVPPKAIGRLLVAYEPLWAIGQYSKGAIEPRDLHEMIIFIRKTLVALYGKKGLAVPILYGGSVDDMNAAALIKESDASGLLVGRSSWSAPSFENLLRFLSQKN